MEVSYGKEPFDLRLMCLRLCRNLWKILAVTVVGTLLFGGGYYVKNVVLQPDPGYAASSTYKVEYKENPNAAGAYYINEATWNTMIHTGEFLDGVECVIPKLIIQPIVENSVLHGLKESEEGNIRVRITGKDGVLCIEVTDDGCGAPEERMDAINHRRQEQLVGHIGVSILLF